MASSLSVSSQHEQFLPLYKSLIEEVVFTIDKSIRSTDIKLHGTYSRVKELSSIVKKCENKNIDDPYNSLNDIAGIRVVCLFREDLDSIDDLIEDNFSVISKDDKISSSDGIGYMSIHYICTLKQDYSGTRYNDIKSLKFEIQTRTLCMDAWATVSHYLAYKSEYDVPSELKRAMHALSGLFYVADNQFAQLYSARNASAIKAESAVLDNTQTDTPINLDTLSAYIKENYPSRPASDSSTISTLVKELKLVGYASISDLDRDLKFVEEFAHAFETRYPPVTENHYFTGVGIIRVSMSIINPNFDTIRKPDPNQRSLSISEISKQVLHYHSLYNAKSDARLLQDAFSEA